MQGVEKEDVIEIDLREIFGLIVHWLWLILLSGAVAGAVGFAISAWVLAPKYESTTKVYILNKQNSETITYSDTQLATQLTKDYNELITSRYVLERVIEECGLSDTYAEMQDRIVIENTTDTRIIGITVKDVDPEAAQYIANTIRDVASEHITAVMDIEAVNIVELANLPDGPSEPSVIRWTAIGILLGVFVCAGIIIIHFLLDDTIRSAEDIEKYLGLSALALIPDTRLEEKKGRKKHRERVSKEIQAKGVKEHSSEQEKNESNDEQLEEIDIVEIADV